MIVIIIHHLFPLIYQAIADIYGEADIETAMWMVGGILDFR